MLSLCLKVYSHFLKVTTLLQHVFLLAIRLCWGWQFYQAGLGKLQHIEKTEQFFSSLMIPMPLFNAYMAGITECLGGLLLIIGLGSRIVSVPLIVTMVVAYATAHSEELAPVLSHQILTSPGAYIEGLDKFFGAAPFLFLLVSLTILIFGPGALSMDGLIKAISSNKKPAAPAPAK
jgi:putative oxidoreductase